MVEPRITARVALQPREHVLARPAEAESAHALAPQAVDPRILELGAYWLRVRPAAGVPPSRSRIDPLHMPKLLPVVQLVDVLRDRQPRFRWRLRGTEIVRAVGADHTGQFLDESHPDFGGSRAEVQFLAVAGGASCWWLGPPTCAALPNVSHVERLLLPLAADGRTVDMLIAVTIFTLLR